MSKYPSCKDSLGEGELTARSSNLKSGPPVYYIIHYGVKMCGLFALYKYILTYIVYAYKKGYIPVIDEKHVPCQFFKDGRQYKDNAWEYFFEQPAGISPENIPKDSKCIISTFYDISNPLNEYKCITNNKEDKELYKQYFGLIKFNKETQNYLDENYKKITEEDPEILGILCRGSDYVNLRPPYHPIQPETAKVISKAKKCLKNFNCRKIWLATEDLKIYKMFKDEFGDMLIDNEQYKFSDTSTKLLFQAAPPDRENHFYNLAKEYLLSIFILSKCKYIIGGITSGTLGAYLLTNGFENQAYTYFWRLGFYQMQFYKNFYEKIFSIKNKPCQFPNHKIFTVFGIRIKIKTGKKCGNLTS